MFKSTQTLFHPDQYQGWGKTKRYFEGWYFKIVNAGETKAFAFIPGIAMDKNGEKQAFVQVLDGKKRTSEYYKFEATDFHPRQGVFGIEIGQNFFSNETMLLDLPAESGQVNFSDLSPWPTSWYSPGIMGPYTFAPFMECYHGVLSMDHKIEGELIVHGESIDFTNGRGYLEKDWGRSFPKAYFWLQTNHFTEQGISLKASVAKIPWLGSSFVGFIAGVWLHNRLIQFTSYNGSRLIKSFAHHNKVEIIMENKNYRLEILAHREAKTQLASPIQGLMEGRIEESMTCLVDVQLFDKNSNNIILLDTGRNAGLEVAGNIKEITIPLYKNPKKDNF
ncbi:MAG: tocopherol cyclase family protein [Bacteroidota bacterium]|nr:tocopherol cyclase family protein [Bacteroidota bacterium]